MYNGEYISRVLDVYQKGSTNKESVLRVLKDIPLTTNESDNYKIISITDKVTNSIIQSEVWDETCFINSNSYRDYWRHISLSL
jgi:hypothetical protein